MATRTEIAVRNGAATDTAAFWLRVSTDGQTIENQRADLERLASKNGHRMVKVYELGGVSASKNEHLPKLDELLSDARAGRFAHLHTWSLDRLARDDKLGFFETWRALEEAGVAIHSVKEGDLKFGSLQSLVQLSLGSEEVKRIGARVKAAKDRARAEGRWLGGPLPYGYRWSADHCSIEIDPDSAKFVRLIFGLYVEGMRYRAIQRELIERGIRAPKGGGHFGFSTLGRILGEPGYCGESNGVKFPEMIDRATWARAAVLRKQGKFTRPTKSGQPRPFQGDRAICGECGSRMGVDSGTKRNPRYRCSGRLQQSAYHLRTGSTCSLPRVPTDEIEAATLNTISSMFESPTAFRAVIDTSIQRLKERREQLSRDLRPVEEELARAKEREEKLGVLWLNRSVSKDTYEKQFRLTQEWLSRLENRRRALGTDGIAELERTEAALRGAEYLRTVAERYVDHPLIDDDPAYQRVDMRTIPLPAPADSDQVVPGLDPDKPWDGLVVMGHLGGIEPPYLMRVGPNTPDLSVANDIRTFVGSVGPVLGLASGKAPALALREILDRLQAESFFYPDRVEVRGKLDVTVRQASQATGPGARSPSSERTPAPRRCPWRSGARALAASGGPARSR